MSDVPQTPFRTPGERVSWFARPALLIEPFVLNGVRTAVVTAIGLRLRGWGWLTIRAVGDAGWPPARRWLRPGIHDLGIDVPADLPLELVFRNPFGRVRRGFRVRAAEHALDRDRLRPPAPASRVAPGLQGVRSRFHAAVLRVSPPLSVRRRPTIGRRLRKEPTQAVRAVFHSRRILPEIAATTRPPALFSVRPRLGLRSRGPVASRALRPRQVRSRPPNPPIGAIRKPDERSPGTSDGPEELRALHHHHHWTHHD